MTCAALVPAFLWGIARCCCGPNEEAYVWGGDGGANQLRDNDRFSVRTSTWTARTDLPLPDRSLLAGATVGHAGYLMGGETGPPVNRLADNDRYDPQSDAWSARTDLPAPARNQLAASTAGGKVVCFAGADLIGGVSNDSTRADEYDPSSDAWAARQDLPHPGRRSLAAATVNERIYAWAGRTTDSPGGNQNLRDNDAFEPVSNTWTARTDIPAPGRDAVAGASIGGRGFCVFGRGPGNGRNEEYDPLGDVWTTRSPAILSELWWPAAVSSSRFLHAFGGFSSIDNSRTQANYRYDPAADSWSADLDLPLPARGQSAGGAP